MGINNRAAVGSGQATEHSRTAVSITRHDIHIASVQHHVTRPSQLLGLPAAILQHRAPLLLGRRLLHRAHTGGLLPALRLLLPPLLLLLRPALRMLPPLLLLPAGLF